MLAGFVRGHGGLKLNFELFIYSIYYYRIYNAFNTAIINVTYIRLDKKKKSVIYAVIKGKSR